MRYSSHIATRAAMALGLVLVAPGVAEAFWGAAGALVYDETLYPRLMVGKILGGTLDRIVFERMRVYGVFMHEMTHAAAARLLGRRVESMTYGPEGGRVTYRGDSGGAAGDIFISLAPYVFPLFAAAMVGARPWLAAALPTWGVVIFDVLLGGVLTFQFLGCLHDLWNNWQGDRPSDRIRGKQRTDIEKNGTAFSLLYIGVVSLAVWGVLAATLTGGYSGAALWAEIVAGRTQEVIARAVALAATLVGEAGISLF
jgi:hypothetical protein